MLRPSASPDPLRPHRVALLYNARSGTFLRRGEAELIQALRGVFRRHGVRFSFTVFHPPTLAADLAAILHEKPDALVVAGGDGTITSVVATLGKTELPLGVLPCGTMNALAADLGLPADPVAALDALLAGRVQYIDVGWANGRPFLCSSALGLMTVLARKREQVRGQPAWRKWPGVVWYALKLFAAYPVLKVELVLDGGARVHRLKTRAIAITNNPLSREPGPIPGREALDTGQLAIYAVRDSTTWSLPRLATRLMTGSWPDDADLQVFQADLAVLRIRSRRRLPIMNDGEVMALAAPLRYEILPRGLPVLVP